MGDTKVEMETQTDNEAGKTDIAIVDGNVGDSKGDDNGEDGETEVVELQHDILTAFFLIKQKGIWDEYHWLGKCSLVFALWLPFFIQLYAGSILLVGIDFNVVFGEVASSIGGIIKIILHILYIVYLFNLFNYIVL